MKNVTDKQINWGMKIKAIHARIRKKESDMAQMQKQLQRGVLVKSYSQKSCSARPLKGFAKMGCHTDPLSTRSPRIPGPHFINFGRMKF